MAAVYSLAEVEKHNVKGDLWMAINGKVYDVSTFVEEVSQERVEKTPVI
jgi:cytochrome b involved in lipid metabolism